MANTRNIREALRRGCIRAEIAGKYMLAGAGWGYCSSTATAFPIAGIVNYQDPTYVWTLMRTTVTIGTLSGAMFGLVMGGVEAWRKEIAARPHPEGYVELPLDAVEENKKQHVPLRLV